MTICAFHRARLRRYSNVTGVLKTLQEGVGIECLAIVVIAKVRLTTDRLVVRLVHERDAGASGRLLRGKSSFF